MSVTHWNAIIAVGISVTSVLSMVTSLIPLVLCARVIKPRAVLRCVWPSLENESREREMAEKHTVSTPGCISKRQELVRQVSEDQSTMINTLHKALSSSICHSTVYRSAKA